MAGIINSIMVSELCLLTLSCSLTRLSCCEDQLKLLNALPRAKNASHKCDRVSKMSQCFMDTRTSVLKEIKEWIEGDDSKCVFWLSGMAGIGKTTIARTIVEQDNEIWIASFFFSRGDEHASDHLLVFPTLAHQLAFRNRKILNAIAEMMKVNADCTTYPLNRQFNEFIAGPLAALGDSRRTILLIIDALDECESRKGASDFLRLLLSYTSSFPYRLRILVTSRPENHILSIFNKTKNYANIVLHNIEKTVVSGDIERFVRHGLQDIFDNYSLPLPDADIMRLVEKSDKLFVHAATALRFIGDENVNDPQAQLAIILGSQQDPDARPYYALDILYRQVLSKSIPQEESTRKQIEKRNSSVISVIVTLREPLPLITLATFVGMEPARTKNALDSLQSVIHVPSSSTNAANEAPRIFHPSFVDFIIDKDRCTEEPFWVDVPVREIAITMRCLEIMEQSLKQNMAGIEDGTMLNAEVAGLEEKVERAIPSELRYACFHWASHVMATKDAGGECLSLLDEFTHGSLLSWMEAMGLLGEVPRAILMLRDVHAWTVSVHLLHYAMTDG